MQISDRFIPVTTSTLGVLIASGVECSKVQALINQLQLLSLNIN